MEDAVLLITAGYDHTIRFWEALSGLCYKTLQHPESQVNRICISPDKRLVVAAGTMMNMEYCRMLLLNDNLNINLNASSLNDTLNPNSNDILEIC